ncbi:hypothetical protein B0O80DRAFT_431167 [Mortierella sp. GBAus27b]|nr:hypothetical protein B0O80DRAFT_431167 [Mortierella sp. GBAus27b]
MDNLLTLLNFYQTRRELKGDHQDLQMPSCTLFTSSPKDQTFRQVLSRLEYPQTTQDRQQNQQDKPVALEAPSKSFSAWIFKDVCTEDGLSLSTDPGLEVILEFTDIKVALLCSDFMNAPTHPPYPRCRTNGTCTESVWRKTGSSLVKTTRRFGKDMSLEAQRNLSGRRGNGPVTFRCSNGSNFTRGVTEVKKDDVRHGVAQNVTQLRSALTACVALVRDAGRDPCIRLPLPEIEFPTRPAATWEGDGSDMEGNGDDNRTEEYVEGADISGYDLLLDDLDYLRDPFPSPFPS